MELNIAGLYNSIDQRAKGSEEQIKVAGKGDKQSEYKQVAKDMESLFAYQMLKVMRETSENISTEKKGPGHDTYMSMFDIELSKLLAERGLGLQDALVRYMSRMENNEEAGGQND